MRPDALLFFIEVSIPLDETGNPHLDRRAGLESDIAREILDVGISCRHIPWLQWHQFLLRFPAERLLQHLNKMQQFHRLMIADVIDPSRR